MPDETSDPIIFPDLSGRDRKLCESAIRQLQNHGVIADFDSEDDASEIYAWSERHIGLIEAYFRIAGLGVRAQQGFPIIQLVLEEEGKSHPLRRRLDKAQTGLLVCLWILYHERMHEVDGFLIPVSVEETYGRLSALYQTSDMLPETLFKEVVRLFERYRLVRADWLRDDFLQSRITLLPTLLTTFRFQDAAEARQWTGPHDGGDQTDSISA